MTFRRVYYGLKPYLPSALRIAFRRWRARHKRDAHADVWPIKEGSEKPPPGWRGWPEGKRFAFVLTHDVEGKRGLDRCRQLMELDSSLGFRSSFNFVPEGDYSTPKELRDHLNANGFEVGVHDLKHDGKLYHSRKIFKARAERINHYLKEWNAVGFRSGFMLHNLEWLHDLNILYDSSTFDTDPFEPQPDGVHTIFPFWTPGPRGCGYIEIPYTLVQDFNLFIILQEKTIDVWKRKLDWIVERGGMALLDVHPDYVDFHSQNGSAREYPATRYQEFLRYVKSKYDGLYWHALPNEVANHALQSKALKAGVSPGVASAKRKIWIDLDNTPHVPFFKPIIKELEKSNYEVLLTARDAFQVCQLATHHGLRYTMVGHHYGKHVLLKLVGFFYRSLQLLPVALREKPALALSHGARSQIFICNLLRIPTVLIMDYEHSKTPPLARPLWGIVPDSFPDHGLHCLREDRLRKYAGLKEDVYAPDFRPDSSILRELGLNGEDVIVTIRPPATEAHYHNPESETLFINFMAKLAGTPGARGILLPRNEKQQLHIRNNWPQWFKDSKVIIPKKVVDGLNLVWHSDLVVSGGGTMNREAAALGVPVYSIFRGHIGVVDKRLSEEGRLVLIESIDDLDRKIVFKRRRRDALFDSKPRKALEHIMAHVNEIMHFYYPE
jgi:predicted glycosyltransferase